MKKISLIFLALALLIGAFGPSALASLPDEAENHVVDPAGALSAGVHHDVNALGAHMLEAIGAEIMVVAVEYIDYGRYTDEMSFALADQWQLSPRGMLLLFSTQEGRAGLAVGEEISAQWPARQINDYLERYFFPHLDAGNYDAGVIGLVMALAQWYEGFYNVDFRLQGEVIPPPVVAPVPAQPVQTAPLQAGLGSLLTMMIVLVIFVMVFMAFFGGGGGRTGGFGRRRGFGFFPVFFWGPRFGRRRHWGGAPGRGPGPGTPGGAPNAYPPGGTRGGFGSGGYKPPPTGGSRQTGGTRPTGGSRTGGFGSYGGGSRGGFGGGSRGGYGGGGFRGGGGRMGGFGGRR